MPSPRTRRAAPAADDESNIIPAGEHWQNPANGHAVMALPDDDPAEEETAADRVAAMLQGARGDARAVVKIFREPERGKQQIWCDDIAPEDFESGGFAMMRRRWGPGDYVVRLYGTRPGKGGTLDGFGIIAAQHVTIAADAGDASAPAAQGVPTGLAQVLENMAQTQARMLEAITNRPQVDQLAQMGTLLGLMTQMREAMGLGGASRGPAPKTILEQLQELKAVKELLPELGADAKSDEPADPLLAMLPGLVDLIKTQQAGAAAQPMPAVTMPPSIAHAPIPATNEPPAPQEGADMPIIEDPQQAIAALQKHLRNLVKLAAANVDPELGADMVYDHLPDELVDGLAAENWFDLLSGFEPAVTPHREWFTKVRDIAVQWFEHGHPDEQDQDDATGEPAGGEA